MKELFVLLFELEDLGFDVGVVVAVVGGTLLFEILGEIFELCEFILPEFALFAGGGGAEVGVVMVGCLVVDDESEVVGTLLATGLLHVVESLECLLAFG